MQNAFLRMLLKSSTLEKGKPAERSPSVSCVSDVFLLENSMQGWLQELCVPANTFYWMDFSHFRIVRWQARDTRYSQKHGYMICKHKLFIVVFYTIIFTQDIACYACLW